MKRFWVGLLNGLLCLAASLALGLALLLACDWLYRADVRLLKISESAQMTEQAVLENYHAAVRYLAPWNDAEFSLPGLAWSAAGTEYFRRLRLGVLCAYLAGLLAGVGLLALHGTRARLGRKVWNVSGAVTLGLSAAFGVLLALDFNTLFTDVNNTLFGSSWKMYEDLDPIVRLFPESFFVHAAFLMLFVCVAGALLQFAAGYTPAPQEADGPRAEKQPARAAGTRPGADTPAPKNAGVQRAAGAQLSGGPNAARRPGTASPAPARKDASSPAAGGSGAPTVAVGERVPPAAPAQKQVFRLREQPDFRSKKR